MVTIVLYELVKESKESNQALETIINLFEPKLRKTLTLTSYNERDDLAQELKYHLIKAIKGYDVDATPGFWELKAKLEKQKIKEQSDGSIDNQFS
ncbi:helix-turn-helix domain-containing protein [Bacillus chungangensis]|uniref:DNA-directed RNA polymerase specialized sigma24 family protein n=1 Tax=Bacillus chungangensis TaxID=587633 RepID=A0ABT9WQ42_9BACI|nr:helix-turn-helix domain-containing protein [Bacillus chungangensis]MDQ0175291.1 DNA-directed RNA polymerase specialized sigma24 family protein [Bacillus chungangensis]